MAIAPRSMTLDAFLQLDEVEPALEYHDGMVTQKMAPKGRHSAIQVEIVEWINRAARAGRSARALTELRTTFAGASHVPDVVVYRAERIPRDAAGQIPDDVIAPPDIAVEIASPGQSITQLVRLCLWYATNGVATALLVDPADRTILVFRQGAHVAALAEADTLDLSDVVPGLQAPVREVFRSLSADYWP
jgi:Uma2 family endonuclease